MFANSDTDKTDHRFKFEDIKTEHRYLNIQEEAIRGCNIHNRAEWVYYPEVGKAIQNDKFINEQVRLQCQSSKVK